MAEYIVSSGEVSSGIILNNAETMTVLDGGTANSTTVNSEGIMHVSTGGTADSTTVNASGRLYISSGGTATGQMIFEAGAIVSAFDGAILDFDISELTPEAGARVNNLAIIQGTPTYTLTVSAEQAKGAYTLAEGAAKFASTITVQNTLGNELGTLTVGGDLETENRRYTLNLEDDRLCLTCYALTSGQIISRGEVYVRNYEIYRDTTITGTPARFSELNVSSGGTVNNTTINSSAELFVSSGGFADLTIVNSDGFLHVNSGGTATNIAASDGAFLYFAIASNTTIAGTSAGSAFEMKDGYCSGYSVTHGCLTVLEDGIIDDITVNEGYLSWLVVSSGGTATNIKENGGGVSVEEGADVSFVENTFSGLTIYGVNAAATVHSGTTAIGTIVNTQEMGDGRVSAFLTVFSSGLAKDTTVNKSGNVYISSGGIANGMTICSGGSVFISSGGTMTGRIALKEGAYVSAYKGAVLDFNLSGLTPTSEALINIQSSSSLRGTPLYTLTVSEEQENGIYSLVDGITKDFHCDSVVLQDASGEKLGMLNLSEAVQIGNKYYLLYPSAVREPEQFRSILAVVFNDEPVFSGLVIENNSAFVSSGLTYLDATINKKGRLVVKYGGIANKTTVNDRGEVVVLGGMVNYTTVNSLGKMIVSSGGTANSNIVNCVGSMYVSSGGTANNTTVNGSRVVSIVGSTTETYIQGGILSVSFGGLVNNTTVNAYGRIEVFSGGIANRTTVYSGGILRISSGGTATGEMVFEDGARVSSYEGAILDFDISSLTPEAGARVNNLAIIQGAPVYTLTVDDNLKPGSYVYSLAEGASEFNSTISVVNRAGDELGTLTFGETLSVGDADYTLNLSDSLLSVMVEIPDLTPPTVFDVVADITEPTNQDVTVTASFKDDVGIAKALYRIGEDGEWKAYLESGVSVSENSTIYFKAIDTSGNESEMVSYEVKNIDKVAPVITLSADTETAVLQTTLTATVDDGSTIQYRIGEFGLWKEYKEPIIASLNETYYFMAMDDAGNIGTNQITFGNIDTSGVLLSTLWSQRGINPMGGNTTIMYNEYTPLDPSVTPEAHCLTGCVNTAAGQLIYYFIEKGWLDLPLTLEEKDEYTSKHKATTEGGDAIVIPVKSDGSTPGTLSFAEINAMLSDFQLDSAEHAAALLYAIGVVLESKYSASSTGTSWNRVFFKRAGFEGETMGGPYFGEYYWGDMDDEMQYTITDAGFEVLIENLEAGLPVGATYPGHAFVIDGYDRESDTFHINLGWGGNQATRWYTRDEMQEELNCEYFVYDLNPEYVETFTVTDARVYGTGTMIRAFEQAAGMIGDNTVAFDPSVAGKTVELLNHITFFDEVISVKDFNMNVLVTESQGGENSYGFYADHIDVFESSDPVTVLTFHASGGSLIVSTEEEFNYAFQMEEALSCTVDADGMLIYGGKTSEVTDAAAVLQALQTCRSENTEVSGDLLDPNGWSYNGSAGEDVFRLSNSSLSVGNVSLGDGDDVLSLTGRSKLYGSIDAGDGSDSITIDSTSSASGDLTGKCNLHFVLAERDDHAMFTIQSSASGLCASATVSVDMKDAEIGTYTLISAAPGATGITDLRDLAITVTGSGGPDFTLSVNGTSTNDYADLILEGDSLKLRVKLKSGSIVVPQTQTWEKVGETTRYIVEYTADDFEHIVQFNADTNALDSYQLPEGSYQVRVKADDGEEWTVIEPVVAGEVTDDPKLVRSNADGNADVFFVNTVSTWESGYVAQHVSSADDPWGGTKENVMLVGKNKLIDVIEGSTTDANVLPMTDDANGDALFVDDIYSASPGELGLSQSRIALIDEIRAGAGNDIVDMTSNKFEYTGGGMTIRGGDGDDTIWANKGDNWLFGDAGNDHIVGASGNDVIAGGIGNDRMHGGGGDDVFTFCDNWGVDNVEQLATGSVTLWFASGSMENWNAETLTYTDGDNSVTVKGVTSVELKFGDDVSDKHDELAAAGAFAEFTSQKIFEESKWLLA